MKPNLTPQQLNALQSELDQIRHDIESKLGREDSDYIRALIEVQRTLEATGRLLIHCSLEPFSWATGVASLTAAHVLEAMEIGHNVMHGQYDFMNDPEINSSKYDWSITGTAKNWKRAHNYQHHAYTNIIAKTPIMALGYSAFPSQSSGNPFT